VLIDQRKSNRGFLWKDQKVKGLRTYHSVKRPKSKDATRYRHLMDSKMHKAISSHACIKKKTKLLTSSALNAKSENSKKFVA
jgi:hypothetical protein